MGTSPFFYLAQITLHRAARRWLFITGHFEVPDGNRSITFDLDRANKNRRVVVNYLPDPFSGPENLDTIGSQRVFSRLDLKVSIFDHVVVLP